MSATIDAACVGRLLGDAPGIEAAGRAFPVETRYLGRDARNPIERRVTDAIAHVLRTETGSVLAFLPGVAEIRRAETMLAERIADSAVDVVTLHGTLEAGVQDRAIAPSAPGRRKVVLATSIAETSLTIEGVRIVIDCGLARVPRYEPDVGLTRLETVRVSRASAEQRRGRAGRTGPGICYRLWDEPQTASLEAANRLEILAADLTGLMLDLAEWGIADPSALAWLDRPPPAAVSEATTLLRNLGAIDDDARITAAGRRLRSLPLPPRLARMVVDARGAHEAMLAAEIALLLTERGLGGHDIDLEHRLEELRRDRSSRARDARALAARWAQAVEAKPSEEGTSRTVSPGLLLALAYPDRIAKNRGADGVFLLANGRAARVDPASSLARAPFLAVAEISGTAAYGRIALAAPVTLDQIESEFAGRIESSEQVTFDPASASLRARRVRRLGAIVLSEQPMRAVSGEATSRLLAEGILRLGLARLPWSKELHQWRDRVVFLRRAEGEEWPDLSDVSLTAKAGDWLHPLLAGKTALAELGADELAHALHRLLPWNLRRRLDIDAPARFIAPCGSSVPIDYACEQGPKLSIRVQEMFGLDRHPAIAGGRVPLLVELLSPAHRPVQVTRDLPGFWRGSYGAVRAEMKGRYPRHPWPEDPFAAVATRRAKPRPR
jgi:ATP-dependent helicase HrpB